MADDKSGLDVVEDILKVVQDWKQMAYPPEKLAAKLTMNMTKDNESENYKDSKCKPNNGETDKKPSLSSNYHLVKCELCDEGLKKNV